MTWTCLEVVTHYFSERHIRQSDNKGLLVQMAIHAFPEGAIIGSRTFENQQQACGFPRKISLFCLPTENKCKFLWNYYLPS